MEDSWICIEEDDALSHHSFSDSDQIDSETEAELYSRIHYEENLDSISGQNSDYVNSVNSQSQLFVSSPYKITDTFCTDEKRENIKIHPKPMNENMDINHGSKVNPLHLNDKKKLSNISAISKNFEKKFSAKKRKSDSLENESNLMSWSKDLEDRNLNELSKHQSFNNRNKKNKHSYNVKQKPSNQNDTIVIDSSDSDSNFVWTEQDSSKNDFKINMLGDVDAAYFSSSDSDSKSNVSAPFMKKSSFLKNLSMPNIKVGENSKGLWHINNEDLHRKKKYSVRYHENIDVTCSNCSKRGHTHRTCQLPKIIKCFICGGPHVGAKCINRICSNCYGFGHDRRRCQRRRSYNFSCNLCYMQGHLMENCPDLWRRYHLTTKSIKIKKGPLKEKIKQDTHLYCWNCGKSGHFGAECPIPNFSRSSFPTWPCVISYSNPGGLLKRRFNKPLSRFDTKYNKNLNKSKNNISVHISDNSRMANLTPGQELNHVEKIITERTKRKKRRMDMRFNRVHQIVTQKDFPRTPKKNSPQKSEDNLPESVNIMIENAMKIKQKNRRKNQLRKLKEKNLQEKKCKHQQIEEVCHG